MNIEALNNLNQFTGSEELFKHQFGLHYTDGVQYLAENADCYWLIDAIASYQPQLRKDPALRDMQFWELSVENKSAVLTCREDSDIPPAVVQKISYTDFPLRSIVLWVENNVLLLPSEH